jgi:hypothetical protein
MEFSVSGQFQKFTIEETSHSCECNQLLIVRSLAKVWSALLKLLITEQEWARRTEYRNNAMQQVGRTIHARTVYKCWYELLKAWSWGKGTQRCRVMHTCSVGDMWGCLDRPYLQRRGTDRYIGERLCKLARVPRWLSPDHEPGQIDQCTSSQVLSAAALG